MQHSWILDVLTDLRAYAQKNDLPVLAAQVEDTLRIARAEIANNRAAGGDAAPPDEDGPGGVPPAQRRH